MGQSFITDLRKGLKVKIHFNLTAHLKQNVGLFFDKLKLYIFSRFINSIHMFSDIFIMGTVLFADRGCALGAWREGAHEYRGAAFRPP